MPAIGALGDFPLTDAQKRLVLEMTLEAVAVVEGDDVPAVVRTLMASMTKGTVFSLYKVPRFSSLNVAFIRHLQDHRCDHTVEDGGRGRAEERLLVAGDCFERTETASVCRCVPLACLFDFPMTHSFTARHLLQQARQLSY